MRADDYEGIQKRGWLARLRVRLFEAGVLGALGGAGCAAIVAILLLAAAPIAFAVMVAVIVARAMGVPL
jgi:hypothetical protein